MSFFSFHLSVTMPFKRTLLEKKVKQVYLRALVEQTESLDEQDKALLTC